MESYIALPKVFIMCRCTTSGMGRYVSLHWMPSPKISLKEIMPLTKFTHICQCRVRSDEQYALTDWRTSCHFDDWAISRFASLTDHPQIHEKFYARSFNYKNVIDTTTLLARGKMKDGCWRTPFYPLRSEHRADDYCEGNAWQWTFM